MALRSPHPELKVPSGYLANHGKPLQRIPLSKYENLVKSLLEPLRYNQALELDFSSNRNKYLIRPVVNHAAATFHFQLRRFDPFCQDYVSDASTAEYAISSGNLIDLANEVETMVRYEDDKAAKEFRRSQVSDLSAEQKKWWGEA